MTKQSEPFIRVREVISYCPNCLYWNRMAPELKKQYFLPHWSEAQLRRHLEMLKAFGFNSIQFTGNPLIAVYAGVDPALWRKRLLFMVKTARELGLTVAQHIWGNAVCIKQGDKWDFSFRPQDWHQPDDRARLETWYRDQVELAPYVDRLITHWTDPGGPACPQCTMATAIEMHNHILTRFRQTTPGLRGVFSLWYVGLEHEWGEGCWPGYKGTVALAGNQSLDRNTDLVIGTCCRMATGPDFDPLGVVRGSDIEGVTKTGRQMSIWGWYIADIEIEPSFHVRTDILQDYFRALPPQTHEGVAWHSIDDTSHGINMQNLYVSGRLMQDPSQDAQALLDDFAAGLVGPANAAPVAAALRAMEQTLTRSRCFGHERREIAVLDGVPPLKHPEIPLPPNWLANSLTAVDAALTGLKTVKLAADFQTAWPVTMEPSVYLGELAAHLRAVRQLLAFMKGAEEVLAQKRNGATTEQLTTAINALPVVDYDPAHTAGLETCVYLEKLADLKQAAGIS